MRLDLLCPSNGIVLKAFLYTCTKFIRRKFINSDGQQFHQYKQNEQSPVTLNH